MLESRKYVIVLFLMFCTTIFCTEISGGEIKMYTLDNGVRLIFKPTTANNILAISCLIDIGAAQESPEKSGLTNFTQTLLRKGTQKRTAEEIALELESLGASMGDETYEDFAEVSAVATVGDVEKIIELMADVLFQPSFPPEEIEKERRNILDGIRLSEDNSFYFTYKHFKRLLYGDQHPYGRPVEGTPETVSQITRDDIVNFHKKYYLPSNMILSVVANIEEKKLLRLIKQYFPPESPVPPPKFLVDKRSKSRYTIETKQKDVEQGFILLGYITCDVTDKDYLPLKVTSAIIGEGMSSRLFVQLRDKLGLAYSVGCGMPTRKLRSHFFCWIGTKPETIELAKNKILEEIEKLKTEPISDDELKRAKNYIIGRYLLDHQTNLRQSWYLGWYELLGLGVKYDELYPQLIEQVTAEEVRQVACKYFTQPAIEILSPKNKTKIKSQNE